MIFFISFFVFRMQDRFTKKCVNYVTFLQEDVTFFRISSHTFAAKNADRNLFQFNNSSETPKTNKLREDKN